MVGNNNSKRKRFIIWGLATMFIIAPLLSWLFGMIYGVSEGSGFAAGSLFVILLPIFFIVGVIILIKGFMKPKI